MNLKGKTQKKKKWPLYCFYAAIAMVVLAGILYFIYCQSISSEFSHNEEYFGEEFDELYSLSNIDSDIADSIIGMGREALRTIGSGESFGLLERYCIEPEVYPNAARVEAEIEGIAGGTEGDTGYLWIAYHQAVYDADGNTVTASGSKDDRVLSRWSIAKINGAWTVTEIKEKP